MYGYEEVAAAYDEMSRARVARRIAAGAAYGGGGIGLSGAATVGLVLAEVRMAKRSVGGGHALAPRADGRYGLAFAQRPGSRTPAAGRARRLHGGGPGRRPGGPDAGRAAGLGLAAVAERPVDLRNVALPGAQSNDLDRQVALVLADPGAAFRTSA